MMKIGQLTFLFFLMKLLLIHMVLLIIMVSQKNPLERTPTIEIIIPLGSVEISVFVRT